MVGVDSEARCAFGRVVLVAALGNGSRLDATVSECQRDFVRRSTYHSQVPTTTNLEECSISKREKN